MCSARRSSPSRPDAARPTRRSSSSTTPPSCSPRPRERWPGVGVVAEPGDAGPLGRPQHRHRGEHRRRRRLPRRRRLRRSRTGCAHGRRLRRPGGARRRRGDPAAAGSRAGRAGSRSSSTGWWAAPTPACPRSPPPVRNLIGAQHVLPARGPARGRRLPPRAQPRRQEPGRRRGDRPLHPHRQSRARAAPSSTTRRLRSTTSFRGAGRVLVLPGALRRRRALEGRALEPGRQPVRARDRARLRAPHPATGLPARAPATPCAGTRPGWRGQRPSSAGLLTTTAGYASDRAAVARRRPRPRRGPGSRDGRLRVLMVTPRNPARPGRRGAPRDGGEPPGGGRRGRGRGALRGARWRGALQSERRDGVHDPLGPRLAGEPRLLLRAADLARDRERRRWSVVHVQSYHTLVAPLAMLRALAARHPLRGHLPRRRALLGSSATACADCSAACCGRCWRGRRGWSRWRASRSTSTAASCGFRARSSSLIPNGTDLESARLPGRRRRRRRRDVLASIGRLERYKGHQRVIAALPHVLERRAGRAPAGRGDRALSRRSCAARRQSSASATGSSSPAFPPTTARAMAALLRRVSLVVLLSDFETHPLVALEAAAAGRTCWSPTAAASASWPTTGWRARSARRERRRRRRRDRRRSWAARREQRDAAAHDLGRVRRRAARSLPLGPPDVEQTSRRFRFS